MRIGTVTVLALLLAFHLVEAGEREPIELSLRLRTGRDDRDRHLDIYVKNRSGQRIEAASRGYLPEFSVAKWFRWTVDGQDAPYEESIAFDSKAGKSKCLPAGEEVLWGSIPLRRLSAKTNDGYDSVIKDDKRHTIRVLPSAEWKVKVKPAELVVGK